MVDVRVWLRDDDENVRSKCFSFRGLVFDSVGGGGGGVVRMS